MKIIEMLKVLWINFQYLGITYLYICTPLWKFNAFIGWTKTTMKIIWMNFITAYDLNWQEKIVVFWLSSFGWTNMQHTWITLFFNFYFLIFNLVYQSINHYIYIFRIVISVLKCCYVIRLQKKTLFDFSYKLFCLMM